MKHNNISSASKVQTHDTVDVCVCHRDIDQTVSYDAGSCFVKFSADCLNILLRSLLSTCLRLLCAQPRHRVDDEGNDRAGCDAWTVKLQSLSS